MKKLVTFLLALVASVGIIYASDTQVDGIWYDFNESNKTATVTYRGEYYYDYSNEYSGSVVIPASVTYNGTTYSVTSIGVAVFSDCSSLTSITIPNSVTSIGEYAFSACDSLTSIVVENGNAKYDSRDNCNAIIETATNMLVAGCKTTTIPNSVTSIGDYAFFFCIGLTSVTIPNGVTSIGDYAFYECYFLTSITIPNSVTNIGTAAFYECYFLTSITIPNSVTSIGEYAFDRCSSLTSITIPNSVTSIGEGTFCNCSSLTSVTIGNSVTSIGYQAFYNCKSLTSVTIPNSVTSIGNYAFNSCSSVTSVTIGNSVTSIGNYAFYGCSSLTSINVDANNANYCSIDGVFFNKDKTTLIQYPSGNTRSEYIIPNSVTSIGKYAFNNCKSLTSVTIGNSLTSIGEYTFEDCSSLTSVTIPNSVTSIGSQAFDGCSKLTSVINYATQPQAIDVRRALWSVKLSLCQLYVPSTSVGLYQTAEGWKDFGNIQPIRAEDITDVSETIITPSENEVEITWPSFIGAASYELVIKDKNGNIVCTLIFNANGQLTSIAFNAPSRNGVPAQTQSAGFSFTITGLDSSTGYDLTLTAKDNSGNAIQTETISFVTTGGNISTDMNQVQSDEVQSTKVLRNGQVLILRNGKTYTMQGQEVK